MPIRSQHCAVVKVAGRGVDESDVLWSGSAKLDKLITASRSRQASSGDRWKNCRSASFLESSAKRRSRATMSFCFARVGLEDSQASEAAQPRGLVVSAVTWALGKLVLWDRHLALNATWSSHPPSLPSSKLDLLCQRAWKPIEGISDLIQCQEKSKSPKEYLSITSWHEQHFSFQNPISSSAKRHQSKTEYLYPEDYSTYSYTIFFISLISPEPSFALDNSTFQSFPRNQTPRFQKTFMQVTHP